MDIPEVDEQLHGGRWAREIRGGKTMEYLAYYVEGLEIKTVWEQFLGNLLAYSDCFSLIYYKNYHNEKASAYTSEVRKTLSRLCIGSQIVNQWPSTTVYDRSSKHVYRMNTYRINMDYMNTILSVFARVGNLSNWDYPDYPMDPCFYQNGYAWFVTSTHEHLSVLYLEKGGNGPLVSDVESIGVHLIPTGTVEEKDLYSLNSFEPYYASKRMADATLDSSTSIDSIMDMLDCHNSPEIQAQGRELAAKIKSINVFLRPMNPDHGQNVWENCALILSERSDNEIKPYLQELFQWLEDMDWPGAYCISDRLKRYHKDDSYYLAINNCGQIAGALNKTQWLHILQNLN